MEKSPARWWDLPSAALFIFCTLLSAWRLTATDWADKLGVVADLALLGAIIGLALGVSKFEKRGVRWLSVGYTVVMVTSLLVAAYYTSEVALGERLAGLGGRLLFTLSQFVADRPIKDPIFFITLISIVYWCIALFSGYQLSRHNNTLAAILPAGLMLLIIHHFDHAAPNRLWMVAFYLITALMLIGRCKYLRDRVTWAQRGVQIAPESGPELSMNMLLGAVMLVVLAWSLPLDLSPAPLHETWVKITRPWRTTRERWGRAFDALQGGGSATRTELFRGTLSLGTQAAQGDALIFKVIVPPAASYLPRLYWRARVYDKYENGIWSVSTTRGEKFSPEALEDMPIPDLAGHTEYEFTFTSYTRGQSIMALPAQPLWISRPAKVDFFPILDEEQDVVAVASDPALESGEIFHARGAIPNPSIEELRGAGEDYPAWVNEHYLQLPANFSTAVQDYAYQITLGKETPYDKVEAITNKLREEIKYRPSIQTPPNNTDRMEWFLFKYKQGYCNYFATAEVLMLRSVGIPARLAVGYSQGEPSQTALNPLEAANGKEYSIYAKNMHAWPEVYFAGIGWVEFEPTTNQDPIIRPEKHVSAPPPITNTVHKPTAILDEEPDTTATPSSVSHNDWKRWLVPFLWITASVLIVVAGYYANRKYALTARAAEFVLTVAERRGGRFPVWLRNIALYTLASPFERVFHSVNQSLRLLREAPSVNLTPAERAALLRTILPEATREIETLLKEFQSAQFSQRGGDLRLARRASRHILWLGIRARVWLALG